MARWALALRLRKEVRYETLGWIVFTAVHYVVDGVRGIGSLSLS
jgi:hypothetical protein